MKKAIYNNKVINIFIVFAFFCFVILIYRAGYLSLSNKVEGRDLREFADSRSIVSKKLTSDRGNIYDKNGDPVAINVSSYTLIAYLDPSRSKGEKKVHHVQDKEKTAKELSKILKMKEKDVLSILNQKGKYQVEFGEAGSSLSEIQKENIEKLNLTGLDFIEKKKRYYPNGTFASYTLGYADRNEEGKIKGMFGLEELLDGVLSGTDGYTTYQKDTNGYKIPGTKEVTVKAIDGNHVYLTIDSNIQFFVEQALNNAKKNHKFDWMVLTVVDAKTGAILGSGQTPSFDPNKRNIKKWNDITVAEAYEPGSIMKTYTYMAAMEAGTYRGNDTFKSGVYKTEDGTEIHDWNGYGFGRITYDKGYEASSNVGMINIVNNFLGKKQLKDYYTKLGFGSKTGVTLANEVPGKIDFQYETEVYNASFGQGITTTPMQHIQALTSIANDGVMLKPYIIDKVKDEHGKQIYSGKREEVDRVASKQTAQNIRDLMYNVVNSNWKSATGSGYKVKNSAVIGKTGTAQLVNPYSGQYYTDDYNTTKSFMGMWPKDDPEIIIFTSVKRGGSSVPLENAVKFMVKNINKYLNIFNNDTKDVIKSIKVENYLNKTKEEVENKTKGAEKLYLGNGNKIVGQYPEEGVSLDSNEVLILKTNDDSYKLPDLEGYSKKSAQAVCGLLNLNCEFKGYGYVEKQSIVNKKISEKEKVEFNLKE